MGFFGVGVEHVCYVIKCALPGVKQDGERWLCNKHYELFTQITGNRTITEFIGGKA